jgi:hypothetical protein
MVREYVFNYSIFQRKEVSILMAKKKAKKKVAKKKVAKKKKSAKRRV